MLKNNVKHTSYSVKERVLLKAKQGSLRYARGPTNLLRVPQTVKRPSESKKELSHADGVFSWAVRGP